MLLPSTQLRTTPYHRMLGAPQTGTPQDQRRDSRTIPTGSSKKPTPNHKGKGVAAIVICVDPREDEEEIQPCLL